MGKFSAAALTGQMPSQVVSTGGLALLAGVVLLIVLALIYWRQVILLLAATVLAVFAYGVVDVVGTALRR